MADETESEDKEKSLYLLQIAYLDEQLERCQLKYDELQNQNQDLVSRYEGLERDKRDVTEQLKRSVEAKEQEAEELSERLESGRLAAMLEMEALRKRWQEELEELRRENDKRSSENEMKAANVERLDKRLAAQTSKMKSMQSIQGELSFIAESRQMKMKMMMMSQMEEEDDKGSSEKEAVMAAAAAAAAALESERQQTTEQLHFLLEEKTRLLQETDDVRHRERNARLKKRHLEKEIHNAERETSEHLKEVAQLRKTRLQLFDELKKLDVMNQNQLQQIKTLRQSLASASEQRRQRSSQLVELQAELQTEKRKTEKLQAVKQEAAVLLRHIQTEQDSKKPLETQSKLQRLLEILESVAPPPGRSLRHQQKHSGAKNIKWSHSKPDTFQVNKTHGGVEAKGQTPPPHFSL